MDYARLLLGLNGRINRATYIVVQLMLLIVWFAFWLKLSPPSEELRFAVGIAMFWINTATTVKRLHDRNRSGWWAIAVSCVNLLTYAYYGLFLGLYFGVDISITWEMLLVMLAVALPLLQTWVVIELFFLAGSEGRNRFGADPLSLVGTGTPMASRPIQDNVPAFLVRSAGRP